MILVRQYQDDLQVYLLKRHPRSVFMADNFVFPGGVVDFSDGRATEWQTHVDLDHLLVSTRDRSWGRTVMPRLIRSNNEAVIIEPWDPDYDDEEISIDSSGLGKEILPVGAPFSRLWYSEGLWRPIPT